MALDRMIGVDDLIDKVRAYNPKTDEALIRAAYEYGGRMHEGQYRRSGEPYFSHPVEVASILAEMRLDDQTIIEEDVIDTLDAVLTETPPA